MSKFTISCELDDAYDVSDIATIIELYTQDVEKITLNPRVLEHTMDILLQNFCDYIGLNLEDGKEYLSAEVVGWWITRLSNLRERLLTND